MNNNRETSDPHPMLQAATRVHRREHGCGAYPFEDGGGLAAISRTFQPARILELGTALGYTACCLASGAPGALVDTIEGDPEHVDIARRNIAHANLSDRITVHLGDFARVLPTLGGTYDLAFFDGFAPTLELLRSLTALLPAGGVFVCANLDLASPQDSRRMKSLFADVSAWRLHASLEGGGTTAWVKH